MMRLTIILLIACLHVSVKGYAQKVTLSGKNVAFEKVFKEIGNQTGSNYAFINQLVKVSGGLTDRVENVSFGEVFKDCFKDQPLEYRIIGKTTLDETVVMAYGATTKRFNTGNVSTVKGEEIEKQPVMNPLEAIEGRSSWTNVTQRLGLINTRQYIKMSSKAFKNDKRGLQYVIYPVRSGYRLCYSPIKSPISI